MGKRRNKNVLVVAERFSNNFSSTSSPVLKKGAVFKFVVDGFSSGHIKCFTASLEGSSSTSSSEREREREKDAS